MHTARVIGINESVVSKLMSGQVVKVNGHTVTKNTDDLLQTFLNRFPIFYLVGSGAYH